MAEKLEMMSSNIIQENIDYIASKFPNALKEVKENGKIVKKIDFDVLKQELSTIVIDDKQERYQMTWPDKKKSILLANSRINATLRPIKEKSVDFDNTKNLYIEGDNLDVLKLLRETYLGKVKMIYIDPPYNTGNDFVYEDDFSQTTESYFANSGQYDDQGNRLIHNTESNGRFHTDWLNMMYPRLLLARNLLTEDGTIFVSISDHEMKNLHKIMDEIFGENNFIANLVWLNKEGGGSSDSKYFKSKHEYILCYAKNKDNVKIKPIEQIEDDSYAFSDEYEAVRGKYKLIKLNSFSIQYSESLDYPITSPSGNVIYPSENGKRGCWRWSKDRLKFGIENDFIVFKTGQDGQEKVYTKQYFKVDNDGNPIQRALPPSTIFEKYSSTMASKQLEKLFGKKLFDYSKPTPLIEEIINFNSGDGDIILDFFSGSATTAHATMNVNLKDGLKRKFIMVQLPELIDKNSEAGKAGYNNICEIGEERIRRASTKIKEEIGVLENSFDLGFRVLKLDSSNMNEVYYNPNQITQTMLDLLVGNIKEDRTALDLLFQVMLELGIELSAKIEEKELNGKTYFVVNENDIVACFDNGIDDDLTKELAKIKPIYAIFKDSSFTTDSANINCEQIFKSISPSTTIKVI